MLRTLLTRRWLAALAVAAVFATACVFLGRWQYGRHVAKSERAALVTAHLTATPVPLDSVLGPRPATLRSDQVWTRVQVRGRYAGSAQLMVRNRPQDTVLGFEVVVPLDLGSGRDAVLVDRGWVAAAEDGADVIPAVPAAPDGEVTVTGWLRQAEPTVNSGLPAGQLGSIDLTQAATATNRALRGGYLLMESEDDGSHATPARPQTLLPPDTDLGPHFAYALQWWGAAPVGFVLVLVYARREHREAAGIVREPKPKKVRIWDEEDG